MIDNYLTFGVALLALVVGGMAFFGIGSGDNSTNGGQ